MTVGVGLVGREVLQQIQALQERQPDTRLRVDFLANSRYQVTVSGDRRTPKPLDLLKLLPPSSASPNEAFNAQTEDPKTGTTISEWSLQDTMDALIKRANQNSRQIFVDNTSDNNVVQFYPKLLQAGIHLVTPNKKGFSGTQKLFDEIHSAAASSKALIYQEATVGAGLPCIAALKDLVATGDRIQKVEGVLSGTLSYIFNEFSKPGDQLAPKFSDVVKIAKDKGYTVCDSG